jgi:hypothetical protein
MRVRSDVRVVALLLAIGLPTLACSKKPASATEPEQPGAGVSAEQPGGDPLAQLHSLEQEMRRLGLPVAAERASVPPAEGGDGATIDGDAAVDTQTEFVAEEEAEPPEPTAAVETAPPPEKREVMQRCSAVCDLSGAICELEVQICSLSEQHGDEPTYTDACRRAGEDCDTADAACDRCQ